jgi:Mg2+ and Co2+ transporter CorA
LHAALQDARERVSGDRDLINARDRAYELERAADLLIDDVRNALQFATARKAEEQAVASHQMAISAHWLNMLAAFFFPIAALTSIFGTNLTHPLEHYVPPPYAFFGVISAGAVLGAILAGYLITRSRNADPHGTKSPRN